MTADEIKEYCKARLQEVECINHMSHTPSAIMAIAAFAGYLSRLAFWGHAQIQNVTWGSGKINKDEDAFNAFINQFLRKYDPYYTPEQKNGQTRKHYWLYSVLRCGLVHSMSFYEKWEPNAKIQPTLPLPNPHILITHDPAYSNPKKPLSYLPFGLDSIVINAFDLCADLRQAIEDMFKNSDVRTNAEEFVKWQHPIQGLLNKSVLQQNGVAATTNTSISAIVPQTNKLSS